MPNLPTPAEMLINADYEMTKAYRSLSDAADWLCSDWKPGVTMTGQEADWRARMFKAIGEAKAAINEGRR